MAPDDFSRFSGAAAYWQCQAARGRAGQGGRFVGDHSSRPVHILPTRKMASGASSSRVTRAAWCGAGLGRGSEALERRGGLRQGGLVTATRAPPGRYVAKPLTRETWPDFAALVEANNGAGIGISATTRRT